MREYLEKVAYQMSSKTSPGTTKPTIKIPTAGAPKVGDVPKIPGISQAGKKDPIKQIEQIQNKDVKDQRMKEAQSALKVNKAEHEDEVKDKELIQQEIKEHEQKKHSIKGHRKEHEKMGLHKNGQWTLGLEKKQGVPKDADSETHERCVVHMKDKGHDKSSAFAICNEAKAGVKKNVNMSYEGEPNSMVKDGDEVNMSKKKEMKKSASEKMSGYVEEFLVKSTAGKQYSGIGGQETPFSHGSTIKIKRAVSDPESGKTHGYEVHETKSDGSVKVHDNVPHSHLDQAMSYGGQRARLRMGSEKATKKHNLHHEAKVEVHRESGKTKHHLVLKPHDDPHTVNVKE